MPFSLRFPIALVLSFVGLSAPAWADFQAGLDAYNRGDYPTALREFTPPAKQGVAEAQHILGVLYEKGKAVLQDFARARQWYEKAAAQGIAGAQYRLGALYHHGYGGPQDFVQAYKWYNLAAANGEKKAATRRDALAEQMTPAQIDETQRLPREWKPTPLDATGGAKLGHAVQQ